MRHNCGHSGKIHVSPTGSSWPVQFSSVAQSCPTLCDPMNHRPPGLPVHHYVLLCCAVLSPWVLSKSLGPHGLWPTRLLCVWGYSRWEYWSGLPCSPPGDLPYPRIKPRSPALQADSLPVDLPGKPHILLVVKYLFLYLAVLGLRSKGMWDLQSFLWHEGSWVVACETLSFSMWERVPWPRMEPGSSASGVWWLSHWTTREVP